MTIHDIALTLQPQIGPRTAAHLVDVFQTAENLYNTPPDMIAQRAMLRPDVAVAITKKQYHSQAERELRFCENNEITAIAATDPLYPEMLRECGDRPHVIYYKGDPTALGRRVLAMVGTRRITSYGQKMCERLVGELAVGYPDLTIVSGLAYGVDGACHRAALTHGLPTVGVLASHLNDISPAQHTMLANEMIRRGGGILSEYHSGMVNSGKFYAARNRIIAGMSIGTVVVESPLKGGSMITAGMADGYNRALMAVPGRACDATSEGPNLLIKSNRARMVCSADDIAAELGWERVDVAAPAQKDTSILSPDAAHLFDLLPDGEVVGIDALIDSSGLSMGKLSSALLELECGKFIRMLPGKRYEKD